MKTLRKYTSSFYDDATEKRKNLTTFAENKKSAFESMRVKANGNKKVEKEIKELLVPHKLI